MLVASTPSRRSRSQVTRRRSSCSGLADLRLFRAKADRIYLTKVDAESDGDTFFSFDPRDWRVVENRHHDADPKHEFAFDWLTLDRVRAAEPAR